MLEEALRISRDLAKEIETPDSLRDLAASLDLVGQRLLEGDADTQSVALERFNEFLMVSQRLADEIGTEESWKDCLRASYRIFEVMKKAGNRESARNYLEKALEIANSHFPNEQVMIAELEAEIKLLNEETS
jgi:hypothetical protein